MKMSRFQFLAICGVALSAASSADAACCYFSAKNVDVMQPAQKVFLTYDPVGKVETFTVQPKFAGNALEFGMVIPTPTRPKLHEMPKEFFKQLAVYTILKKRQFVDSKLLPQFGGFGAGFAGGFGGIRGGFGGGGFMGGFGGGAMKPPVRVLETGVVGTLDYKIVEADRADSLFQWLKDHKYRYAGDEATLGHYVNKKWFFTVMKIDTTAMKKNRDGTFLGEVTPTRFQFASEKFIYPLKITQISVKDKTEALFYVQAPTKIDLPGDWTYQYTWAPMLQAASGCTPGGIPGGGEEWLKKLAGQLPALNKRANELGFAFVSGARPGASARGHIPTTMEWARKLTAEDIQICTGMNPYSEKVPDPDEGFAAADLRNPKRAEAVQKVIRARLDKFRRDRPLGYLVREAPAKELEGLKQLAGHLEQGLFVTKFRKTFCRDEMNADIVFEPARRGEETDTSEYQEVLPSSPP